MGVAQPPNVRLVSQFPVVPLNLNLQDLIGSARTQNPGVLALRSREHVADLHVRREKGEYSPTLSLSTGIGGYTYGYTNSSFPVQQASAQLDAAHELHSYRGSEGRAQPLQSARGVQRNGVYRRRGTGYP